MRVGAEASGPGVTAAGDRRVTPLGRWLRRTKLDELPQLWNVVRGDMALVGPRPEDPRYVDLTDPLHRRVFSARPGITGPTALAYRSEEPILAEAASAIAREEGRSTWTEADLDRAYRVVVLPAKLTIDSGYLDTRSTVEDLRILVATLRGR
jgi:lipopolysaccharide/colanic/teichoic acid biosynthesis glycosyltransferase